MNMRVEQCQWTAAGGWNPPLSSTTLATSAQVVLLFGHASLVTTQKCVAQIRQAFPNAHLFGCGTAGEIQGARVDNGTLALTAIAFAHSRVATARAPIETVDSGFVAGEGLIRQLNPNGLRHVFVLCEGLQVNASDLVKGINATLPPGVSASGGFAADGHAPQATLVWSDSEPQQSTAIALGFYGEGLHFGLSVTGGWRPFGPDRLITKSHKNVLYEFDGHPALALYKQYLGEHAAGLPAAGLMFPLELCLGPDQKRVMRALIGVDEQQQSITFAGDMPEGSNARFMMGHIEDLIDGALNAAKSSLDSLNGRQSRLSLLVSCAARRFFLNQRVEEEVEAVRDVLGAETALTGFYSYGEIAPPEAGGAPELHNETMSITSIAED
ncbi:MAG: FIST N-terminal domain-containing protein [Polyangia bacterium]